LSRLGSAWRRLAGLLALLVVAVASDASGQSVFHGQSQTTDVLTSAANTTTLAHTTANTDNRILLVSVGMNIRNATATAVASVTYGGVALTRLNAVTDAGPDTRTEVWYLLAPPTGANNVVVTAGGITPGQNVEALVGATTFSGVSQTAPPSAARAGQNSPATVTIPTASGDTIIDFVSARETVTLDAAGAQTEGFNISTGGSNDDVQAATSQRLATGSSTTMSWSVSANRRWSMVAVNLTRATADVEVTQTALPDPVVPGGVLTYRFVVRNQGPSVATGVVLSDPLPESTTLIAASTTLGSCGGIHTVNCALGTLAVGQEEVVTIAVMAPLTPGLTPVNTGTVTTTTVDPGSPNFASARSTVVSPPLVCAPEPGKDGAGGTLTGIVNAYWPGTASAAAGASAITLGTRRGAAVSITAGDLVLVIQMQDAQIDSNNDDRYGSGAGTPGAAVAPGAGVTSAGNAGRYEYAVATNTVGAAGGSLSLSRGLLFAYTNASATATAGQRRFQVVRVPQYVSATLGSTLTASGWNGTTGGILALDVAGTLGLGGATVSVNGRGSRGGAGLQRAGGAGSSVDYRSVATDNAHGIKGEGIPGTPEWVLDTGANLDTGPQGYPNGDYARGAPGNAGGGGTDGDPSRNDQNSGGGGGANGGNGGRGGNTWSSNLPRGGFGGAAFGASGGRVVLGGGGGAGSRNGSSGIASSGGAGGGIVLIRAGELSGTGTIGASGADAFNDTHGDAGGGGGAGGSIVVLSRRGGFSGAMLIARGGRGGDAGRTQPPNGFPGERHGPGGGGGGGFIATNGAAVAVASVTGGASGITTTANDVFGAQPGAAGTFVSTASFDEVAGITTACAAGPQRIAVSKSFTPVTVVQNERSVLTITLANPNPAQAISGIELTDVYPFGLANHAQPDPVNTCGGVLTALVGASSLRLSDGAVAAGGQCTVSVGVVSDIAGTYVNTLPAGAVTTANAGRTEAPASATLAVDVLSQKSDPTRPNVFKRFDPGVTGIGGASTLTITIVNGTVSTFTGLAFVDPYPAGLTNAPAPNVTNTCGGEVFASPGGSSVSLLGGALPSGSSCEVTVAVTGALAGPYENIIETGAVQVVEAPPNASPATASLLVSALAPPTVVKSFAPAAVRPGEPTRLTIRVTNPNPTPLTVVNFTDRLPAGLTLADPPEAASTCGGDLRAFPGGSAVAVGEGTVPASGQCTVSVLVVAADSATGTLTNTIAAGAIVSANAPANAGPASASLAILPGAPAIPIPLLSPAALCVLAALLAVVAVFRMRVRG
jgi:uncharacterized repeat protein (TIGR01451 family)